MILFRRVNESFRQVEGREWALLFLETVGVVAGILIAFELNEWASRRAAAQHQHELIERLFEESEATVTILRDDRDNLNDVVGRETAFATALVHRGECPAEPMWSAVDTLPMYPTISVPTSAYDEIMGSGGLSTIEDTNVRRSVAFFHRMLSWTQGQNEYFRSHVNYPLTDASAAVTYDLDVTRAEPQVSHYDRATLCRSHAFKNGLADTVRNHMVIASMKSDLARSAVFMCARIGNMLGKSCQPGGGPLKGIDAQSARDALSPGEQPG